MFPHVNVIHFGHNEKPHKHFKFDRPESVKPITHSLVMNDVVDVVAATERICSIGHRGGKHYREHSHKTRLLSFLQELWLDFIGIGTNRRGKVFRVDWYQSRKKNMLYIFGEIGEDPFSNLKMFQMGEHPPFMLIRFCRYKI